MRITCPKCGTVYEVEDRLVPSAGVNAKCANCNNTFFVEKKKPSTEEIPLVDISAQSVAPTVEETFEMPVSVVADALEEGAGISLKDKWAPAEPSESGEAGGSESDKTEHEKSAGDADIAIEEPAPDMAEDFGDVPLDIGDRFDDFSFDGTEYSDVVGDLMELQLGADIIDYSIIDKDIDTALDDSLEIGEGAIAGMAGETIPEPPGGMPQEDDKNAVLSDLESVVGEATKEVVAEEPDPDENLSGGQFDINEAIEEKGADAAGAPDPLRDIELVVGEAAKEVVVEEPDPDENLSGGQFDISGILDEKAEEAVVEESPGKEPTGGQLDINDITLEETPEEEVIQIKPEEIVLEEAETDAAPLEIGEVLPYAEETVKETEKSWEEAVEEIVPEVADDLPLEEISIETEVTGGAEKPEPAIEEESGSEEGEPPEIGLELSEEGDIGFEPPAVESDEKAGEENESGESAIDLAEPEPAGVETEQTSATEESFDEAEAEPAETFAGEESLDELIHEETEAEVNYVTSVTAKLPLFSRWTAVDILVGVAVVTVTVAALAFLLEKIGLLRAV